MKGSDAIARARAVLVRGLAIGGVVLAYAFSGVGAQVASVVGVSSLGLLATSQPAAAHYRYRRRRYGRRRYRRRWYRRGY
jgi:hypothetical protein